ncbi:MAG: M24 family metallopeptidase [Elusimicrobiaceae bacterium]
MVTVEPGVYFEGKFGIRYENTVLVTDKSAKILTK